jgi:8-oxo-dGTP pyrophosphatase MutT (NUDIX family)
MQLLTAGLVLIQERKLLLAFSRHKLCFYLPGSKIDPGENTKEALCREIAEEMNTHLTSAKLSYYTHITAAAYGEESGVIMEQDCFLIHQSITPQASSGIGELRYFSLQEYLRELNTASGAVMILEQLTADGLID